MKILLVEDELAHYETFSNVLEDIETSSEIELVWARTDKEALEKYKQHDYTMVFMDISLKGSQFNGIQLIRVLRQGFLRQVPIITYSISRNQEDQQKALEAGSNIYIKKPFNYEEMIETFSNLINQVERGELI